MLTGLSEAEAARILAETGYNELPSAKPRNVLRLAIDVLREPMLLLLLGCTATYFFLGNIQESFVLSIAALGVVGIDLYQKRKTERALDALRDFSSPRALVIRDGEQKRIAGREVVPGDILLLAEGDRVPADAVLQDATNLATDESLLTGESVPVRKMVQDSSNVIPRPGGDDLPFVFSGSLVVSGTGIARVLSTGSRTELGKIGKSLQSVTSELSPLETDTGRLVRVIAASVISMCVVMALVFGLARGEWLRGFLASLTLAMALLPEELPVVLTVFLALGAWRISRARVLTRETPAIEALGAATVLCVDKTGTLTQNQMSVRKIFAGGRFLDVTPAAPASLPEEFHELVEFAVLASHTLGSHLKTFDPMDRAIGHLAGTALAETEHLHPDWTLVRQYPLAKNLLAISQVWNSPDGEEFIIAAKGAPEAILDLCHASPAESSRISATVAEMANQGLRVLGVAKSQFRKSDLPPDQHVFTFELLGLIGLSDPIRAEVPQAIEECRQAGVRVVMITGDYPGTAASIAREIGLEHVSAIMTGPELEALDEPALRARIGKISVFARIVPDQKLRLVQALKANGEIVAMTGDGVNDAPALKAAHIGIAMGQRGTDVAREAADLVLLDDDFSSIVKAIRLGRRIFDNLKKAAAYIFAVHIPIAGLSLLPLFRLPFVLEPMHIAFLELIIDPACTLVFEAEGEEADVMHRPPRASHERLFQQRMIGLSVLQGAGVLVIVAAIFTIALYRGQGEADARALTFTTLVIANLSLILTNRSWSRGFGSIVRSPNAAMWWVMSGTLVFLALALSVPFLRGLFHFSLLHPDDLLLCLTAGVFSVAWFEGLKWLERRHTTLP
jgi:P-type Ca2+ transporter type 2C